MRQWKCLLRLSKQNLDSGSIIDYQTNLFNISYNYYNTIMIIKANKDKEFAVFIPSRFSKTD